MNDRFIMLGPVCFSVEHLITIGIAPLDAKDVTEKDDYSLHIHLNGSKPIIIKGKEANIIGGYEKIMGILGVIPATEEEDNAPEVPEAE